LPTKQKDIRKLHEEDNTFSKRVSDWMDQIKGLNSPILLEYANKCPDCDSRLQPIQPTIAMFRKGNKSNGPPLTCECLQCDRSFSSYQLNLLYVDKYAFEHGIPKQDYSFEKIDVWSASCEYLDISEPFQMIVFTLALMDLQFHYWHHAKYVTMVINYLARVSSAQRELLREQSVAFSILVFFSFWQRISIQ
jgi:hypothetical protein